MGSPLLVPLRHADYIERCPLSWATRILGAFDEARSELVGKAVVLTDGKAGTIENVWLDEEHGLRISIRGHGGKWPVSTIKFAQTG